jgi:hypothetical protein
MACVQQEELRLFMLNLAYGLEEIEGPLFSYLCTKAQCLAIVL